jgi:outer-membrane receptor for ferric coprogen and ferric-rhodotorulic acid
MKTTYGLLATAALALILPMTAHAAHEEPPTDEEQKSEEIVVYGRGEEKNTLATGLDLSPRQTPQSISIITREQLEDQAAVNVGEALGYTTGISVKAVDRGRNTLAARGFDITNYQLDGAPFVTGNIGLEKNSSATFERIEVIRGANGLMQGSGEPSATINLVRKHATSRDLTGSLDLEGGSWNRFAATGDITVPLTADGSVRGRFVAQYYRQDSFVDLEKSKGYLFYGVIDADLGANTRVSIGASYQRDDRDGTLWGQLPYWYSDGTRTNWARSKTTGAGWNLWDTTEKTAFVSVEQRLGNRWSLRADVAYHEQFEESKLLWTGGAPDRVAGPTPSMTAEAYWYETRPKQWNASMSARGNFDLLGREHELIVGGNYRHLTGGWTNRDPVSVAPIGDFNLWDGAKHPEPEWGNRYRMSGFGTTEQYSIYGAARLQLLDPLKLIAGARVSWWERNEEVALYTPAAYTISHKGRVTPYAGLVLDVTGNISAYASFTSIFNPQDSKDRNGNYLPPVVGNSYEGGLKGEWMNGRLRGSAAIFRIEQDNFAVVDDGFFVPGTTNPAMRPARGTVSEGYEAELAGKILKGWDLSLGWSAFRAKDANGAHVQQHHPRRILRLSTRYDFSGMLDGFSIGGSARWESEPPKTGVNPAPPKLTENVGQPAYLLVNVMARYKLNDNVSLQLNVNNLFDKSYFNNNLWFAGYVYGEPRNVRATLRLGF